MTEADERQRIACARARLWTTLSNDKYKGDPDTSTVEEIRQLSDVLRLNSAKASLRQTLSGSAKEPRQELYGCPACQQEARRQLIKTMSGRSPEAPTPVEEITIEYRTAQGSKIVSEVTPASILKLNQARRELQGTMAGLTNAASIALAKDDLIRTMQGGSIKNVTMDANDSDIETGTLPNAGFPITIRSRGRTLDDLYVEEAEKAQEDSPSSSVASGQGINPDGDWSVDMGQDTDYSDDQEPFDADAEADAILDMYSGSGGTIRKHAKSYFLHVDGSGDSKSDYRVALARMNKVSQTIDYDPEALDAAWKLVDGSTTGLAVRSHQNRLIRIKQRNRMPLTPDQESYVARHMR